MRIAHVGFPILNIISEDLAETEFVSVSILPKEVTSKSLFFAFCNDDYYSNFFTKGHRESAFEIATAIDNGATACVVRMDFYNANLDIFSGYQSKLLLVSDAIVALQLMARSIVLRREIPIVAITGSAGKTSTKDLIAEILISSDRNVLKTPGNSNNGIGVPITIANLISNPLINILVLEMGMSAGKGEIARLCTIAPPDVGIVLNVLPVHLERLQNVHNIRDAKSELVSNLKPGGIAVLNIDDPLVRQMQTPRGTTLSFGLDLRGDIAAEQIRAIGANQTHFVLRTPAGKAELCVDRVGVHNIRNMLASVAAGIALDVPLDSIVKALQETPITRRRGNVTSVAGCYIIDESYNSNPAALIAAVEAYVCRADSYKRLILVIGDMLEIGDSSDQFHYSVGYRLGTLPVYAIISVGRAAGLIVDAAGKAGRVAGISCVTIQEAFSVLLNLMNAGDAILIKGSNALRLDLLVDNLIRSLATLPNPESSN